MERLSDKSIEIINALHTERLDYDSEYLPLIDCAQRCAAYEDTGYEPGQFETAMDAIKAHLWDVEQELKAYKDTGLTSAEIVLADKTLKDNWKMPLERLTEAIELIKAKDDGRLVVLPCKVTDTVYIVESIMKGKKHIGEKVVSAQIDHVTIGESKKPVLDVCSETGNWYIALEDGEFWITRREAEAAMREAEHG